MSRPSRVLTIAQHLAKVLAVWSMLCFSALCLAQSLAGPAADTSTGTEENHGDRHHLVLRVGLLDDYPPFQRWPEGGDPSGYDIDLLGELADQGGFELQLVRFTRFASLRAAVLRGEVDIATSMGRTAQRSKVFAFTRPYVVQRQVLVGRRELGAVADLPDLAGLTLALVDGYASATSGREHFPQASVVLRQSESAVLDAVAEGKADVGLTGLPGVAERLRDNPDLRVMRSYAFATGQLRLAGLPGNPGNWVARLDDLLAAREPHANEVLVQKWLSDLRPQPRKPMNQMAGKRLRVGYSPSDNKLRMAFGTRPAGLPVDIMKRMADHLGMEIERFIPLGRAEGLDALRAGRIDVMMGVPQTKAMRESVGALFVGPYLVDYVALVSRRDKPVEQLGDSLGLRLALPPGHFARDYLSYSYPDLHLVDCANEDDCFLMVGQQVADVTLAPLTRLEERLPARNGELMISGFLDRLVAESHFVLSPELAGMVPAMRDALDFVRATDEAALRQQDAERLLNPTFDWRPWLPWVAVALAVMTLIFMAVWWHLRQLRNEAGARQAAQERAEAFLAFMTHEVRNALQSVAGASVLLQELDEEGASKAERRHVLQLMRRSSRSTMALMDSLMDRHRFRSGQGQIRLENVDLVALVRDLVQDISAAAEAKHLTLNFEAGDDVAGEWRADPLRLEQILRNLIVNSIKFTPKGHIDIRLSSSILPPESAAVAASGGLSTAARRVTITVRDTGKGMTDAQKEHLFERFHSHGGDRPGTGLGLSLCKDLAEAMGGRLTLNASNDEGTEFALYFDAARVMESSSLPQEGHGLEQVLVIDSSPVYGLLLKRAFAASGIGADLAESVREAGKAMRYAQSHGPAYDLIVTDNKLADGELSNVLQMLRAQPAEVEVPPVMVVSQDLSDESTAHLRGAGVIEALAKRSDVYGLVDRIRQAFEAVQRRQHRQQAIMESPDPVD
ncbi:transporter substrate-binding domain-containing protein [Hydrogenophaga sp. 5NK40-0174]|uniref:transporter substrate-binding domain-containing protein n=1 Tax=Hydrogenophaga sp. 5NK40-0174 TaxID=3127649 RepID=UPI0031045602